MARKNTVKEKRKLTWRFYTILSASLALVCTGVVILLVCLYNHFNTDTYRNRFEELTEYKINYDDLMLKLKDNDVANDVFILVYDEAYMDEEAIAYLEADDTRLKFYQEANIALDKFLNAVKENQKAEQDDRIQFYVVNASLQGNSTILNNESLGNLELAPGLIYYHGEECVTEVTVTGNVTFQLTGGGTYSEFKLILNEAKEYIEKMLWKEII